LPARQVKKKYKHDSSKILTFDNFKLILNKIPNHVRIDFSGMTEPFLNPEAIKIVQYSYEKKDRKSTRLNSSHLG
jgi:hypothetical protein